MWHRDSRRPDYRDERPRYPDNYHGGRPPPPPPGGAYPSSSRRIEDDRDRYYGRGRGGDPGFSERDRDYAYSRDREREREAYSRDDRERRLDWERERYVREREHDRTRGVDRDGRYRGVERRGPDGYPEPMPRPRTPPPPGEAGSARPSGSRASMSSSADPDGAPPFRPGSPGGGRGAERRRSRSPISPRMAREEGERRPSAAYATAASQPTGPRLSASRPPPRGPAGWSSRSGDRYGPPGGAPLPPPAARRVDDMPARSLSRKRDSEGAPILPDLAPVPTGPTSSVPGGSTLDAQASWDGPSSAVSAWKKEDASDASAPLINPYSGTVVRSSSAAGGTPKDSTTQSPSTPLANQAQTSSRYARSSIATLTTPIAPVSRPGRFSAAAKLTPELDAELLALQASRRAFLASFTAGPKRSAIRAAMFELRDAQLDLANASHRVLLSQQALEAVKDDAEKYTLAENQKEWAAAAAATAGETGA